MLSEELQKGLTVDQASEELANTLVYYFRIPENSGSHHHIKHKSRQKKWNRVIEIINDDWKMSETEME